MRRLAALFLLPGAMTPSHALGYDAPVEIRYPNGSTVPFTAADKLWTARMVYGEGGDTPAEASAIIWTLVQRKYWGTGMEHKNPRAFAAYNWRDFIRTFSQPINPRWYRHGPMCRPGGAGVGTRGCDEVRLHRRDLLKTMRWEDIPAVAREATQAFIDGKLPNSAPGVIDFAAGDTHNDKPRAALGLDNVYFYSIGATSREWGGAGISISTAGSGGDRIGALLLSLVPGGSGALGEGG